MDPDHRPDGIEQTGFNGPELPPLAVVQGGEPAKNAFPFGNGDDDQLADPWKLPRFSLGGPSVHHPGPAARIELQLLNERAELLIVERAVPGAEKNAFHAGLVRVLSGPGNRQ